MSQSQCVQTYICCLIPKTYSIHVPILTKRVLLKGTRYMFVILHEALKKILKHVEKHYFTV